MNGDSEFSVQRGRRLLLIACMLLALATLVWRAVSLQVLDKDFLQTQGQARHLRVVTLPAHRGMILDRQGELLAVSTPVESVWVNPRELIGVQEGISRLAQLLRLDRDQVQQLVASRAEREFVYLRRHVSPVLAGQVRAMNIPGVYLQKEYKRYYPAGEVAAHVVGFNNIDDVGQEGLELAFGDWLRGEPGAKRVIKDGRRKAVEDVESIRRSHPGKDLPLSIDRRIQYLAYRELKAAMKEHQAQSASAVVLDVRSGEILAMVNQPSYNPNNRHKLRRKDLRNRAVTDVFEPGSTMKPFIVATALESGLYTPETPVSTAPGWLRVGRNTVRDVHDYGLLDVAGVIRKSSNVGITKIALSLPAERIWSSLSGLGFGVPTDSGFPGESSGLLTGHRGWNAIETATLAFGYGMSATPLQLAQAYAVLAAGGIKRPVSFLRQDRAVAGQRVFPATVAQQVVDMLEAVTGPGGTAPAARVTGYRVAGKTGTVRKSVAGGYSHDKYLAVFAGMAPASDPRLVMVVMINEPSNGKYYGGLVAAPVFSSVMSGALRLLAVPPDDLPLLQTRHGLTGEPA
ncbi:MAG: penicillin-binding transpeptidase domain-containing protein [Pseudomonadota bacterium]|nr:penicillin-binding transpeptidase domain-containing protein [Pseudomonadota bacterium]